MNFTAITPRRVLDTRNGIGAPAAALAAGQTLELATTAIAGVPANADAVVLNMTAVNARAAGFATIYPCGQPRPDASNLNFTSGQTIPNLVIARPGTNSEFHLVDERIVGRKPASLSDAAAAALPPVHAPPEPTFAPESTRRGAQRQIPEARHLSKPQQVRGRVHAVE